MYTHKQRCKLSVLVVMMLMLSNFSAMVGTNDFDGCSSHSNNTQVDSSASAPAAAAPSAPSAPADSIAGGIMKAVLWGMFTAFGKEVFERGWKSHTTTSDEKEQQETIAALRKHALREKAAEEIKKVEEGLEQCKARRAQGLSHPPCEDMEKYLSNLTKNYEGQYLRGKTKKEMLAEAA